MNLGGLLLLFSSLRRIRKYETNTPTKRSLWSHIHLFWVFGITAACLLVFSAADVSVAQSQSTNGLETGRHIYLQNARAVPVTHVGSLDAMGQLTSGTARPLSLASGDFDQDGIQDLVAGYAAADGTGVVTLHRGNIDAFAPKDYETWLAIGQSRFPSPFVAEAQAFQVPTPPDFLATGNFVGDDHVDLIAATKGQTWLYLFAGDGQGNLAAPRSIPLPGPVTAMSAGRFGNTTQPSTVIVGTGGPHPSILLYASSSQNLQLLSRYDVPSPASAFAFDDLDGDGLPDAAVLSGGQLLILHAGTTTTKKQLESIPLPFPAVAFTTGFFVHDRGGRRQIAVLDLSGTIHLIAHGEFDSRAWSKAEVKAMREALAQRLPNPFRRTQSGPAMDGWKEVEVFPAMASSGTDPIPILLHSRVSGQGTDDVLVIDSQNAQLTVASHARIHIGAASFRAGQLSTRVYSDGTPVAALSFPVNVDAREGLVILHQDQLEPAVMMPVPDPTFWVNHSDDPALPLTSGVVDPTQFCNNTSSTDMSSPCSLREAVIKANADAGDFASPDTIMLPGGTVHLAIPGAGTTDASTGHLDITDPVTIVGMSGTNPTVIQADVGLNDQVFLIDALEEGSIGFPTAIRNLVIQGGQPTAGNALVTSGGAILWEAGSDGTGQLQLTSVSLQGNNAIDATNAGLDDGGALALFNTAPVTTPAQVTIASSIIQGNTALDAGGGIALKGAISLNLSGTQVIANHAVGGGAQQGGGLFLCVCNNAPAQATSSPSQVNASVISGNIAGNSSTGQGGGIWSDQAITIGQGTAIQNNQAGGAGGGFFSNLSNPDVATIRAATITGNNANGGSGGGIEVNAGSTGNLTMTFSRIVYNSAKTGTGLDNAGTGAVSAADNWWGCNEGPLSLSGSSVPIKIFNSGVTAAGALAPDGSADSHYSLIATDDPTGTTALVANASGSPISPNGSWLSNGPNSKWLSPIANANNGVAPGTYIYQTKFDLTGLDPSTAHLSGNWAVDDSAAIVLNGVSTSNTVSGFQQFAGFSLSAGFINGINVLDFVVGNAGTTANASGFRAEVSGSATQKASACDLVSGSATVSPWITLSQTVSPSTAVVGSSTTLTAGFQDSNPSFPQNLNALAGIPVTFRNAVNGTFANSLPSVTGQNATASVGFTAQAGPIARADVQVDKAVATATIAVSDFSLTAGPNSQTVNAGAASNSTFTVSVAAINGFNGPVSLSVSAPAGLTASLSSASINGPGMVSLTLGTSSTTTPNIYSVSITGVSGQITHTATVHLMVADFSLAGSPSSMAVSAGQTSAPFTITGTPVNGFNGTVTFGPGTVTGLPPGASLSPFSQTQITVANGSTTNTTAVTIVTSGTTPPGTYNITVTGTSGALTHSVQFQLVVGSFSLSVLSPGTSQTVSAGGPNPTQTSTSNTVFNLAAQSLSGFSGTVNLTATISSGSSAPSINLGAHSVVVPASGQTSFTTSASTTYQTTPGTYTITVTATSGSIVQTASLTLTVTPAQPSWDFLQLSQSTQTIATFNVAKFQEDLLSIGGFTGTISLTASVSPSPSGILFGFPVVNNPGQYTTSTQVTISNPQQLGTFEVDLVGQNAALPVGTYTITVNAQGGGISRTLTLTAIVIPAPTFSFSVSPSSATVTQGSSVSFTVTLSNFQNIPSGTVFSLSAGNVNSINATSTFSPSTLSGPGSSTFTINTTSSTLTGSFQITVGASATVNGILASNGATIVVQVNPPPPPSFSFSVSGGVYVTQGQSASYTYSVSNFVNFNGSVSVSVSGIPTGTTSTLAPGTFFGQGSGTLTVNTSSSTPAGTYTLTLTATGGSVTRTATTTLSVGTPAPPPPPPSPPKVGGGGGCTQVGPNGSVIQQPQC